MYSSVSDGMSAEFGGARAGYRREFEEMESRIRKCERQRAELERQFADLMRERAESERAAARAMKQRQKRLLEAERQRMERNESILRMLNKIDQQAASLAAKTDRLKMLKTQYEMYLMRTYSSAQSSYPSVYHPPMIAAPPSPMLPKAPQSPSKSSFAQYLSDLTLQQQQASIDPIPAPTALSNYLATQQQKNFTQSAAPLERPYSRMFDRGPSWETEVAQRRPTTAGSAVVPLSNGGEKAKRLEMSNEDFIRYIDSEVLKEPIPTVSVVAPTPEGTMKKGDQVRGAAYLEDAGLSEDEQRPVAVDRLTEVIDQFRIVAKEDVEKEEVDENPMEPRETRVESASMALEQETESNQPILEDAFRNISDYPTKVPEYINKTDPSPENEVTTQHHCIDEGYAGNNRAAGIMSQDQEMYNVSQEAAKEWPEEESNISHTTEQQHAAEYPAEQQDISHQQPTAYASEDQRSSQPYNDQFYQMSSETEPNGVLNNAMDVLPAKESQLDDPLLSSQEHVHQEQISSNNDVNNGSQHLPQQMVQQPISQVGNQHWTAARQAMRTKAFPGVSSKVPSPEMTQPPEAVADPPYEVHYDPDTAPANQDPVEPNAVPLQEGVAANGISENTDQNVEPYPEYVAGATEQSYYSEEPASDRQEASPAQGYQDDGMGQPVDYQTGPLGDGQQAAMYQYQQADGQQATYQEGQYVEGTTADQMQYQYAEGADQTATQYSAQEGYQDPNQQYQYDPQYYDQQQQQQQGYEGQYYSEDPQQQQDQQQYYMEDPNQQQGHYEDPAQQQQDVAPVDQYQPGPAEGQAYYPTDAQYEPASQHPVSTEGTGQAPTTDEPTSESPKAIVSQSTPDVPSVEASPVADVTLPKDKSERKSATGKQKNDPKSGKKGSEPASDTPTVSSVNDESDFDFSTQ